MPSFSPPTYKVEVPRSITGGPRYQLTESYSVVRVSGTLTQVKTPTQEQLTAAGVEGEDFFIGGTEYQISVPTADELTAAGFQVQG